jgi:hypothetical protein
MSKRKAGRPRNRTRTRSTPLMVAYQKECSHSRASRKDNAAVRACMALRTAAHAVVGYKHLPPTRPQSMLARLKRGSGYIIIPFKAPWNALADVTNITVKQSVESHFGACAMDMILHRHSLFAASNFFEGMGLLIKEYGHGSAEMLAVPLMGQARQKVIGNIANIQALASETLPRATLLGDEFRRAARKSGVEAVGSRRVDAVATHVSQFAATPALLRQDLGTVLLNRAAIALHTNCTPDYIPPCPCPCGNTIVSLDTIQDVLIDGLW